MSFSDHREMKSIYSKSLNGYAKDKEKINSSLKNEHVTKLEKNHKRFIPSPISTRAQFQHQLQQQQQSSTSTSASNSITTGFPFDNYKKQTRLLFQGNKTSKAISVNRREHSLDLSHNDSLSFNKSKISSSTNNSIYKQMPKKAKGLRSNTPNMSMTSMKKLNLSAVSSSSNCKMQKSFMKYKNAPIKSSILGSNQHKGKTNNNNKLNNSKDIYLGRNIFGNMMMKKTTKKLMFNKKRVTPSFSIPNINYTQIMSQKRILEINTTSINDNSSSCNNNKKAEKRDKITTTSSQSSLITKEMTPKIQKTEVTPPLKNKEEINIPVKIRKRIKCMHDLSKTGLSGEEKKVNQDNYFIFKNFSNQWDFIYMGVCDGHGYYGHEVSGYIKENLPMDLNHAIKERKLNILTDNLEPVMCQIFETQNYNLLTNTMIDSKLSGTTCVSVLYTSEKLIIANIGDSRAVLGRKTKSRWEHKNLSRDHKPTEPDEEERILKTGGRIRQMKDDDGSFIGPMRVYMKEKDMPGLSMTRSFGDYFASTAGCISIPEVTEHCFQAEDKFIVIASDGLWEFIDSQEVVDIVKDFYLNDDIVTCCEFLYKESCRRWINEEEDVIDDITIILVFLD